MARKKNGAKLPLPLALLILLLALAYNYVHPGLPGAPSPPATPMAPEQAPAPPTGLKQESWQAGAGLVTLHSIDIGQGDATLLVFPGDKTLLVDAGPNGQGKTILNYFKTIGVDHLDWIVATNPDADHIGGIDEIVRALPVKAYLEPGQPCPTKTCADNDAALAQAGITKTFAHRGEALDLGNGFKVGILSPAGPTEFKSDNDESVVLFVDTQGRDFLLTGDCEKACEHNLVQIYGDQLKADVYKAGHHGSRTSSSQEFLDQIKPVIAVVSAGKDNKYGHPHPETLEKFKAMGVRVLRTDELGDLMVYSDESLGCCRECRDQLAKDPHAAASTGTTCAGYSQKMSLLCREHFAAYAQGPGECLG